MDWVTCENTYEECWRRLLEYANIDLAIEAIEKKHGKSTKKNIANYKKQANQIRVSLLQAKEYFEAAKSSSLYTQPNHLYYGAVALSTACMLIRGDGTMSLDQLRLNSKNAHHGLDFTFSANLKTAKQGFQLLEESHIKICPHGHFHNWYNILDERHVSYALTTTINDGTKYTNLLPVGESKVLTFDEIANEKVSLMKIIEQLPDLQTDLSRYGAEIHTARGSHKAEKITKDNTTKIKHIFTIHNAPSSKILMGIIDSFDCDQGVNFSYNFISGNTQGTIVTRPDKNWNFSYPSSRDTLDHSSMYYVDGIDTHEVVDLYLVSYALSMLSRYYPDIWVSFLESHCKGSKLVERIVRILILKLPVLMLNQLSDNTYIISTHRPYWH